MELDPYEQQRIRTEFYELHHADMYRLDHSCVIHFIEAPDIANGRVSGYDHRVPNRILPGEFYAEALYECDAGFGFGPSSTAAPRAMYCSEGEWVGRRPQCVTPPDGEGVAGEEGPCEDGYEMSGGQRCEDVDECATDGANGGCDQLCVNKPGSFMCDCRKGYNAQGSFCSDENECLLNNGHGPCQDTCTNTNGGYLCSCEGLAGTQLAGDNLTCAERKGCSVDNGGCTHQCMP